MESRHRENNSTAISGTVVYNGDVVATGNYTSDATMIDDFIHKKVRKAPPQLEGFVEPSEYKQRIERGVPPLLNTTSGFLLTQWPAQYGSPIRWQDIPYYEPGDYRRIDADAKLVNEILARTNPGRPIFSVPVFIRELVDIPSMFALAAKSFYKFVGGAYLNYRFGWVQFVNDIRTLGAITRALEHRSRELQSLLKHGGLRRSVKLSSKQYETVLRHEFINGSWSQTFYGDYRQIATLKKWGTVRWVCSRDFADDIERLGFFNRAVKEVFDLEMIDAETIWQMLPWSWLVDYFYDVGTFLGATESPFDFKPYDISIIWEAEARSSVAVQSKVNGHGTDGRRYGFRKSRTIRTSASVPQARVDLLSRSQLEVLMALILRFKG